MAHENISKVEKLLDFSNGTSIWRVHIDACREQDKNARVMPLEKFDRLTHNIAKDKRLESLPLVTPIVNEAGNKEFLIISGHHRIRGARAAGLEFVPVFSIDEELTRDQIRAKQLAHNALSGYDDHATLAEIYAEIEDINAKLESGIFDKDLDFEMPSVRADDLQLDFDYEILQVLFLPKYKEKFEEVLKRLENDAEVYLADKADFERMKNEMITISKSENIRNVSAIMAKMVDIVGEYYRSKNGENI